MEPASYTKYERAKKKVKEIRGFYSHILVFVIVNAGILIARFFVLPSLGIASDDEGFNNWLNWNTFIFPGLWLIAIIIHGLMVYRGRALKNWEDKKIEEILQKDEINIKDSNENRYE